MGPKQIAALVLGLLVAGLVVRLDGLTDAPVQYDTNDEYAWTWAGMSLLADGTPRSWSWHPAYEDGPMAPQMIEVGGRSYRMVEPWVDHPPVYPLLVGTWLALRGETDPLTVDFAAMRQFAVLVYAFGFLAFAAVLRRTVDDAVALPTLAAFALSAPVVLQSRLVLSEGLLIVLLFLALLGVLRFEDSARKRELVLIGLACALLPLTKVAGLPLCAAILLFCAARPRRSWAALATIVVGTVAGIALMVGAGWFFAGDLYFALLTNHSGTHDGFAAALPLLFIPRVVDTQLYYGPFLMGAALVLAQLRHLPTEAEEGRGAGAARLALVALAYAGAMSFFAPQVGPPGWYSAPLHPFFCLGIGLAIERMWRDEGPWALVLVLMLVLPLIFDPLLGRSRGSAFQWIASATVWRFAYLAVLLGVPVLVLLLPARLRSVRRFIVALLLVLWAIAEVNIVRTWVDAA